MEILKLSDQARDSFFAELSEMPDFLEHAFGMLSVSSSRAALSPESFSATEHCWHLADLEREGFATRIHRLLEEDNPTLPNFDGNRIANERNYNHRDFSDGLDAFREARLKNVELLRSIDLDRWNRAGTQEGVGLVMLCDLPAMMAAHDDEHRKEIDRWLARRAASTEHPGS